MTPETLALEGSNIAVVLKGRDAAEPILGAELAARQSGIRYFFNASQRTVVEEVLTGRDRIHGLQGLAGTGKTTALEALREGAERGGYAVEGFAPTSKAAGQLREAGISADTLQSFLARAREPNADPRDRHLYMLDESSLASTARCGHFSKGWGRATACSLSATRASIRASMPGGRSSRCSRRTCERRS